MTNAVEAKDIEAELSYAYLHAVASHAGAACKIDTRLADNNGIDAVLTAWGPFPNAVKIEVDLKVQLKATIQHPVDHGAHFSYTLKHVAHYNDLRKVGIYSVPRILIVLFLPKDQSTWLDVTADALSLKRSAYWVSLTGAPEVNTSSVTVHIPKANLLTQNTLSNLFAELAKGNVPTYSPMGK